MRFSRILIAAALSLASSLPVVAAPIAYASNEGSGTVSMIDTATDKVTATFSVGGKPRGIALSPDGKRLYLSDQTANAVLTVDAATGALLTRTALGKSPEGIYLSSDGKLLAAAVEEDDQVMLVDTASGKVVRKLKMRGKNPEHAVFSPDDRWLYVSSEEADSVDIVDLGKGEVVQSVKVGDRPRGIGFLPDGKRAYVAAENADTVNVIDVATMKVIASDQGRQPLERRHRPPRRQARLRELGRRRNRAGHRYGEQRDHCRDTGRQAAVEHGDHAGRQQALRRVRAGRTRSR